jgi:hypothetical protein
MVTAVARQDRVPRMRMDRALGRPHNAGNVCESDQNLAFELSSLDALRMAGNLGGESALSAAAKYQRIASFVIRWPQDPRRPRVCAADGTIQTHFFCSSNG